jgi:DNA-directed RNA polymerase specialized sigma24 family protein
VALHYLADLPVAEVARLMGCRAGTVKAHLAHAREVLRVQLEGARNDR